MPSSNNYTVDFPKLAVWLVNRVNRRTRFILLVRACLYPLTGLHSSFLLYRKAKIYQLDMNGQVCYLERVLRDKYDFTKRRIEIVDALWYLPWFVYLKDENKPQPVYLKSEGRPRYVYTSGESGTVKDDFVVLVPRDIDFAADEMRSLIDSYKLFGTKYTIQRV